MRQGDEGVVQVGREACCTPKSVELSEKSRPVDCIDGLPLYSIVHLAPPPMRFSCPVPSEANHIKVLAW